MLLPLFMFLQSFLVSSISNTIRIKRFMGDVPRGTYAIALVVVRFIQTTFAVANMGHKAILFRLVYLPKVLLEWSAGKVKVLPFARNHFPKVAYMERKKSSVL